MRAIRKKLRAIDLWLLVLVVLVGSMLATLSVMRFRGYNASMLDLGNMAQAIWSATQGRPLECTYREGPLSRLALHAEVIYFLIAPLYALFPSPVTILIVQALLFASAGFPLCALAYRRLQHVWASRLIVVVYLLYPVAQTAVLFDFHGDTLAMPLLVFMLDALDRRSWREYGLWLLLALSCKHYVSVAIVAFGVTLILQGDRKVGWWTAVVGLLWGFLAFFVLKLLFAPAEATPLEATSLGYFTQYFGQLKLLLQRHHYMPRLATAVIVLGPAVWLGWRGWRWFLPVGAIVIPALLAIGNVAAYDYRYHHYAIAVPFIIRAVLAGAEKVLKRQKALSLDQSNERSWLYDILTQTFITLLFACYLVDIPINPNFILKRPWWGFDSWAYGRTSRDVFMDEWLNKHVPPKVSLMTTGLVAPHVINRSELYMELAPIPDNVSRFENRLARVSIVVLDALFDYSIPSDGAFKDQDAGSVGFTGLTTGHPVPSQGGVLSNRDIIAYLLQSPDFHITTAQDGMLVFHRNLKPDMSSLSYSVEESSSTLPAENVLATFGEQIALASFEMRYIADRHYEMEFIWVALKSLEDRAPFIAVSRLGGVENARIVHLATEVLLPTTEWHVGVPVLETFDVVLPETIPTGSYPLHVGWYDSSNLYAAYTDERSRVSEEYVLNLLSIQN